MSLIPYRYFVYLNLLLGIVLVITPAFLNSGKFDSATLGIIVFGLVQIVLSALSKENKLGFGNILDTRIYTLGIFLLAIILNFLPYILKFTSNLQLLWVVLGSSGIALVSILFTNFKFLETK